MTEKVTSTEYNGFIKEIKELIYRRQYEAMKKVNAELIQLYWEIGEEIEYQQREKGWGKSIVEVLSKELQKEFPGVAGFSARNLWLMRSFYIEYSQNKKLQPMGAEMQNSNLHPSGAEINRSSLPPLLADIGWKKNVVIMQKCKDPFEREPISQSAWRRTPSMKVCRKICVRCSHRRMK